MSSDYFQLGGIVVIAISLIELIKFIINKYTAKNTINGTGKAILDQLRIQNENHLRSISQEINSGFDRLEKSIIEMHLDLSNKLTEIATILKQR